MKRVIPALIGLIVITSFSMAQTRQGNFSQRGTATREIERIDGLYAAHPSLPIGSKAMVTNVNNGTVIEVAIIGRIQASSERIIDLSPDAAWALGLETGGEVIVSVPDQQYPRAVPLPEPPPSPPEIVYMPEPAPVVIPEPEPPPAAIKPETQPVNITIYYYNYGPEKAPVEQRTENAGSLSAPQPVQQVVSPPSGGIRISPGLPDPNSGKVYHLQVGAFSSENAASGALQIVRDSGFNAVLEISNNIYRVSASDVPAAVVFYAIKRLEVLGFTEVWIRE